MENTPFHVPEIHLPSVAKLREAKCDIEKLEKLKILLKDAIHHKLDEIKRRRLPLFSRVTASVEFPKHELSRYDIDTLPTLKHWAKTEGWAIEWKEEIVFHGTNIVITATWIEDE